MHRWRRLPPALLLLALLALLGMRQFALAHGVLHAPGLAQHAHAGEDGHEIGGSLCEALEHVGLGAAPPLGWVQPGPAQLNESPLPLRVARVDSARSWRASARGPPQG